jgi:two-component system, OmpR family, phosphate regulon sensor histidine kinase PhoR
MIYSKIQLSLLASFVIGAFTGLFLYFIPEQPALGIIVGIAVSMVCSFVIFYLVYENLIERRILQILEKVNEITINNLQISKKKVLRDNNPIKKLDNEINVFIQKRNQEIANLKDLENYRKEFIANISHELKTPVFAVQGYIDSLMAGAIHNPEIALNFLSKASESIDRLDFLIKDILTISKSETGQTHLSFQWVNFDNIIHELTESLGGLFEKKNIDLEIKDISPYLELWADEEALYQIMKNLVENAVKYSEPNTKVKIRAKRKGSWVEISVSDQGPGIKSEDQERIFERFYRVDKSRSSATGGTGLGLSIVKHLLVLHDAQIKVKSILGKGTKFYFTLSSNLQNELL